MPDVHRHPYTRGADAQLGRVEDLAALPHELPLFRRVARLLHRTGERDHVAGDRAIPHRTGLDRAERAGPAQALGLAGALRPLLVELVEARHARARHRLVRGHHHPLDPGRAVERRERGDRDHRRAVRARHDPARQEAQVFRVDLGDHERHVVVHAERCRVVDDARAAVGGARRPLQRERVVDIDDDEVETVEATVAQHLADHLAAGERQLAAFRARRRVDAQFVDGERALLEQPQHLGADETGRADDADA